MGDASDGLSSGLAAGAPVMQQCCLPGHMAGSSHLRRNRATLAPGLDPGKGTPCLGPDPAQPRGWAVMLPAQGLRVPGSTGCLCPGKALVECVRWPGPGWLWWGGRLCPRAAHQPASRGRGSGCPRGLPRSSGEGGQTTFSRRRGRLLRGEQGFSSLPQLGTAALQTCTKEQLLQRQNFLSSAAGIPLSGLGQLSPSRKSSCALVLKPTQEIELISLIQLFLPFQSGDVPAAKRLLNHG